MKYICETFDSIDKMLNVLSKRGPNQVWKGHEQASIATGEVSFRGTETYEAAVELIKKGWEEPVKELKSAQTALRVKANGSTLKTRPRNSVVGYAPCVPAAILGLPESMIATERTPQKIKAVSLIYCSDASGGTPTKEFLKCGAVVLNIVNELELKGYRVRLVNEFTAAEKGSEALISRVVLKDWRQPLDLKKITFPLAHSSMCRRFSFRYTETQPELRNAGWRGGYGVPLGARGYNEVLKAYRQEGLLTENEYYINLQMVKKNGYDMQKVMEQAGMKL